MNLSDLDKLRAARIASVYQHFLNDLAAGDRARPDRHLDEEHERMSNAQTRASIAAQLTQAFFIAELREEWREIALGAHVPAMMAAIKQVIDAE